MVDLDTVVEIAKEVGAGDPIDYGRLIIDKDNAYRLIATSMLEYYQDCYSSERELMLLAVATHLAVENFVLHTRLLNDR